mgnify:CR=1 FL=1
MNIAAMLMTQAFSPATQQSQPSGGGSSRQSDVATRAIENVLGKEAFLNLLLTQLRYQNPLEPVKDQDFVAQMAQFSALEQMQNLTRAMEWFIAEERFTNMMAHATSLLGRKVEVSDGQRAATGTVEAVKVINGVPHVVVGGSEFRVTDVVKVLTG